MHSNFPDDPDAYQDLEGYSRAEWEQKLLGELPTPPEPKPLPAGLTRAFIALPGLVAAFCAWNTTSWIRLTGIAVAALFLCAAILPARRRR